MTEKKLTFNDLKEAPEVAKHYGMNSQQLEKEIRRHYRDAYERQMKEGYNNMFKGKR